MKKIIFLLTAILLATSTSVMAQQTDDKKAKKEAQKAEKEAKKAAKQAEKLLLFEQAAQAMNERKFLYKIDRIQIDNGRFTPTDNRSSFFELNDSVTASQMDTGSTYLTPKLIFGSISDFESSTDKKGNLIIKFVLKEKTSIIPQNITMKLEYASNECAMTIAERKGTRNYIRGTIVPLGSEVIFRGTPVIY
ncbi:MAG: DUF4251 domain-containing protein [Bacteroidaceae bacterium]|nr:DUF4251 domain-containing protein [Bacteroidaceae bacterium]